MRKFEHKTSRLFELEDAVKERDRRIEELRREVDDLRDLTRRTQENLEDAENLLEQWRDAFDMEMAPDGNWTYAPFFDGAEKALRLYRALVRKWNDFVPRYNAVVTGGRNIGRPIAASEAQRADVQRLRKRGFALRSIAEDLNLSLQTVRTILDSKAGRDRTTRKHLERIAVDPAAVKSEERKRRARARLPKAAQSVVEASRELRKEAKGLSKVRRGR